MKTVIRKGITFNVTENETSDKFNFWNIWADSSPVGWESQIMDATDKYLPKDGTFLDIGAWIGPHTIWASKFAGVIWAIEPDPVAFETLQKNINQNCDEEQSIFAVNSAATIDDENEFIDLYFNEAGDSGPSLIKNSHANSIKVPTIRIDQLCLQIKPDLVKMDIEGGEAYILPILGPILRNIKSVLILELHYNMIPLEFMPAIEEELSHWAVTVLPTATGARLCLPT